MSCADKAQRDVEQTADKVQQKADQTADKAHKEFNHATDKASREFDQAKDKVQQNASAAKRNILERLKDDGVVNPSGLAFVGFSGMFFAAIPVTSWIAQPNGLLEKAVNGLCSSVAYLGSAGSARTVPQSGKIAALGALYVAMTFAVSGAGSAAGTAAGNKAGRDNNYPRAQVAELKGLPHRLHAAHYNLMEMFPGWAIAAALTQAIAPGDQHLTNLLGLHVIAKVFLYYPSYLANAGSLRSVGHVLATGSVIGVLLKLARKPLL